MTAALDGHNGIYHAPTRTGQTQTYDPELIDLEGSP